MRLCKPSEAVIHIPDVELDVRCYNHLDIGIVVEERGEVSALQRCHRQQQGKRLVEVLEYAKEFCLVLPARIAQYDVVVS